MFTLGTHFEALLSATQPPAHRLEAAKTLPRLVRDFLAEHESFVTVEPHSRLAGSYAQHLSVGDVKDVDFLVRVPGDPTANDPEPASVINQLRTTLRELPEALGYSGGRVDVIGARRSVHVYFEEHDFHLDVVPCIAPEEFEFPLYVPDRGFSEWILSHPIGYVELLNDLNREHGKKVKKLIRLLKHFRNYAMQNRRPKSYWLGALVVHHVTRDDALDTSKTLAELFADLLDAVYRQYAPLLGRTDDATPKIPDPMLGHNISWNWKRTHFETFMRRICEARDFANRALDTDDRDEAVSLWQRIFGEEYFPSSVDSEVTSLAAMGQPGSASVSPSGLVIGGATVGSAIVTKPTTFHGTSK